MHVGAIRKATTAILGTHRWLAIAVLAAGGMALFIFLADFSGGDPSPKLMVATGFYETASYTDRRNGPLELLFRYDNSSGTIGVTRIAGPSRFQLVLSGIFPDSCSLDDEKSLKFTRLHPDEWIRPNAAFVSGRSAPVDLYQFAIVEKSDSSLGEIVCRLAITPRARSHEIREIRFLHSLQPRDQSWYRTTARSSLDQFVFDDLEGANVRGDDEATFRLAKRDTLDAVNEANNTSTAVQPNDKLIAVQTSYATFEWTDGRALRSKEILFFLAGLFSAVAVSCVLEQYRDFLSPPKTPRQANPP